MGQGHAIPADTGRTDHMPRLPPNTPRLRQDEEDEWEANVIRGTTRPWSDVFDAAGIALVTLSLLTWAFALMAVLAGLTDPSANWAIAMFAVGGGLVYIYYVSQIGIVVADSGKTKVRVEDVEADLRELEEPHTRFFDGTILQSLSITAKCYHMDQRGFGDDATETKVVTHNDTEKLEFQQGRLVGMMSSQVYKFPLTRLTFSRKDEESFGVVFHDEETMQTFQTLWEDVYRRNRDRDERISMSMEWNIDPASRFSTESLASGSREERTVVVVRDSDSAGLRWISGWRTWLMRLFCCGNIRILLERRHTVEARVEYRLVLTVSPTADLSVNPRRGQPDPTVSPTMLKHAVAKREGGEQPDSDELRDDARDAEMHDIEAGGDDGATATDNVPEKKQPSTVYQPITTEPPRPPTYVGGHSRPAAL